MRTMAKFTLKSLRANKIRTLVTILGVALASALLTAVMTSYTSLNSYLYESEKEAMGSWMVNINAESAQSAEEQIEQAKDAQNVSGIATVQSLGFAELTQEQQNMLGHYLPISSYTGNIQDLCSIRPTEGKLPEAPDEILLSTLWKTNEQTEIGDQITLNVGKRVAVEAPASKQEEPAQMESSGDEDASDDELFGDEEYEQAQPGEELDSTYGFLDPEADGGNLSEKLVDTQPKTYTVVGFIEPYNYALSTGVGQTALVGNSPDTNGDSDIEIFVEYSGLDSQSAIEKRTEELFPNDDFSFHSSLLRYLGIRGEGLIWGTFFGLVAVLAAVIMIACISLIYNAFAISVAERSSQFGLLATIGASRRQLRRSVILEGLVIACIGIPLGILIGIGGCALTFYLIGPMISAVLSNRSTMFAMKVSSWGIAFSAVLTLVTVLVSVLLPALKISRTNPIQALRQNQSGKISKRGMKDARKSVDPSKLWKRHGSIAGGFGIGGRLARINSKRSKVKGRAASLSLALAIVLLMTAGSFNVFVRDLIAAADTEAPYDIAVTAQLDPSNESKKDDAAFFSDVYEALCQVPGAKPVGWRLSDSMAMVLPDSMVNPSVLENADGASTNIGRRKDGSIGAVASISYLDDASFDSFARQCGTNPSMYQDNENPCAIAINKTFSMSNGLYNQIQPLDSTGTAKVLIGGKYDGKTIDGFEFFLNQDENENACFEFVPISMKGDTTIELMNPDDGDTLNIDDLDTLNLSIDLLTDDAPEIAFQRSETLSLIMPMSALANKNLGDQDLVFTAAFDAEGTTHAELTEKLEEHFDQYAGTTDKGDLAFYNAIDYRADSEGTHALAMIVNVFCLLFTCILTLIAMANVFNTVTNGLILRRREFAVMRSIGLSNRQFRSMVAQECLGYGIRGLIPGLIASVLVSYLLYSMVNLSMQGVGFTLPWAYLGIAIALTFLTMLISVAYGMHRCKADNVVEALRSDNI